MLVELRSIPAHARSINTAHIVLAPACVNLTLAPAHVVGNDKKRLYAVAWCIHPYLVPTQKLVLIPEPEEPLEPGILFLRPEEVIHFKQDVLWYRVQVRLIEYQDWNPDSDSSDDDFYNYHVDSADCGDEDYPGSYRSHRRGPWPRTTRLEEGGGTGPNGHLPSLGPGWGPHLYRLRP